MINLKIIHCLFISLIFLSCSTNSENEASSIEIDEETAFHDYMEDSMSLDQGITENLNQAGRYPVLNKLNFEDSIRSLYEKVQLEDKGLPYKVFRFGMIGFLSLKQDQKLQEKNLLSIIDFTQSSCNKRFYTIDLDNQEVIFNTLVSHGRRSGGDKATSFSDRFGSNQSSLGFYVTAETYTGSKGYSLRLDGVEKGINTNMRRRAVVMHAADYVSEDWIKRYGRIGRSLGCPALPRRLSKEVINRIKDRTAIFAYYDDTEYIRASKYLNLNKLIQKWEAQESNA